MKNLTIKKRLYVGALFMASAMLVLLCLTIYTVWRASDSLETVYESNVVPTAALLEMDRHIKEIRFRLAGYVINQFSAVGNSNHLKESRQGIAREWALFRSRITDQAAHIGTDERALIARIERQLPAAERLFDRLDAVYARFDQQSALSLLENEWPQTIHLGVLKPISRLIPVQQSALKEVYRIIAAQWRRMLALTTAILVLATVVVAVLTVKTVSAITVPLTFAVDVTGRIAEGDMDTPIVVRSRDEIGLLLESFAHMRHQIKTRQQRLETILDTAAEGIVTFDARGMIEGFNQAAETLFGHRHDEIIGAPIGRLIVFVNRAERGDHHAEYAPSNDPPGPNDTRDHFGRRRDGTLFPMDLKVSSMVLQDRPFYTALISDITERKRAEEALTRAKAELEARVLERTAEIANTNERLIAEISERTRAERALAEQAVRDPLTGLNNRRSYHLRIREEIARAQRSGHATAILVCDLDGFKAINDTHGHHAGDQVLIAIARILLSATRGADFVFRWGGDEFVVVLPESNREGLLVVADRIRRNVRELGDARFSGLDVTIGAALYPEHGVDPEALVRLADRALYVAKKGGDKLHIGEEEYRLDDQAVRVVFQPVMDVRLNQVLGYEALGRDPQGKHGIVALFRRYHAIGKLHEFKCLCFRAQIAAARHAGIERLFINADLNVLKGLDIPPKPAEMEVVLEISEAEALKDVDDHLDVSRKWRRAGYKFAMDDFGAGFVSLPFIARLVPDYIKLDRATIVQAVSSNQFKAVLQDLIHALRRTCTDGIIAEGIETQQELSVMKSLGIYLIQGYLFGTPRAWNDMGTEESQPRVERHFKNAA